MHFLVFLLLLTGSFATNSYAQNILRHEKELYTIPVDQRTHPELRAEGLTWRGFVYKPRLELTGHYDSNVRALNNQDDSDYSLSVRPGLYVQKKYDAQIINGFIGADIRRFSSLSSENREDIKSYLRGYFELNSDWAIPASVSWSKKARPRSAPQAGNTTRSPEDVKRLEASFGITRRFNHLSLSLISEIKDMEHEDGNALLNNTPVVFSDNDRTELAGILRARYEFERDSDNRPEYIAFADFKFGHQDYDRLDFQNGSFSGNSGDNDRYGIFAGFETTWKDRLFSSLGLGYTRVNYEDDSLEDVDLMTAGADVSWILIPKMNLNFGALREINQDNDFLQGFRKTEMAAGMDYEIRHDLYLGSELSYGFNDFIDSAREDDNYGGEINLRYLNSHRLETHLGLGYFECDSSDPAQDFDRYHILLSLVGKI